MKKLNNKTNKIIEYKKISLRRILRKIQFKLDNFLQK